MEKNEDPAEAIRALEDAVDKLESEEIDSEDDDGESGQQLLFYKSKLIKYCPAVPMAFGASISFRTAKWGRMFKPENSPLSEYIGGPDLRSKTNCIVILGVAQYPNYPRLRTLEIWTAGIFTLMKLEKRLRVTTIKRASKVWFAVPTTKLLFSQLVDRIAQIQQVDPVCLRAPKTKSKQRRTRAQIHPEQKNDAGNNESAENIESDEDKSRHKEKGNITPPIGRVVNLIRKGMSVTEAVNVLSDEKDWEAVNYLFENKEKVDWFLQHAKKDGQTAKKKAGTN